MKESTFYYSVLWVEGQSWDFQKQCSIVCTSWKLFAKFCQKFANEQNKPVRGCITEGYSNQGSYFIPMPG